MKCPHCKSQNVEPVVAAQSHALHHPDFYRCQNCGKQFSIAKTPRPGFAGRPSAPRPGGPAARPVRGNPRGARGR